MSVNKFLTVKDLETPVSEECPKIVDEWAEVTQCLKNATMHLAQIPKDTVAILMKESYESHLECKNGLEMDVYIGHPMNNATPNLKAIAAAERYRQQWIKHNDQQRKKIDKENKQRAKEAKKHAQQKNPPLDNNKRG